MGGVLFRFLLGAISFFEKRLCPFPLLRGDFKSASKQTMIRVMRPFYFFSLIVCSLLLLLLLLDDRYKYYHALSNI